MAAPDSTAQFNAVATAVVDDLADGQRKIEELNKAARHISELHEQAQRGGFAAFAAKRGIEIPRTINESAAAEGRANNGYQSLVAQADETPKYGNAMRSNDSPAVYRSTVARADDSPAVYRSTVAQNCDYGFDTLDSVERSLQTIEAYLRTLEGHLPSTATESLVDHYFKGFKRALHDAETALLKAHEAPAAPAAPARPTNPSASRIVDIVQAAVDEVMSEA
jgi:hypothetical protein